MYSGCKTITHENSTLSNRYPQTPFPHFWLHSSTMLMYMETTLYWGIGVLLTYRRQFYEFIFFYFIFYLIYFNDIHDILSYKVIYILFIFTCSWISFIFKLYSQWLSFIANVSYHKISIDVLVQGLKPKLRSYVSVKVIIAYNFFFCRTLSIYIQL